MRIRLEPRVASSQLMRYGGPVMALVATVIVGGILFAALGKNPVTGIYAFFIAPLTTLFGIGDLLVKATPLVICAIGLSIGFRGNVWNIGAEGQLIVGAVCGGSVALAFYPNDSWYVLPLMVLAGMAGGMAWASIPAFLRNRFNVNEILTSLMLTYVAIELWKYMITGPLLDPGGSSFPQSREFPPGLLFGSIFESARYSVLFAVVAIAIGWLFMTRALQGFKVDVVGQAIQAAQYAGFSQRRVVWLSFLVAGGAAGLAGLIEITGPIKQLPLKFTPGYGFVAIIVAFVGRLHPVGMTIAALLMALMFLGGDELQFELNLPPAIAGMFQGLLLFFVLASEVLIRFRIRVIRPARRAAGAVPEGGAGE
jgi:ABC-type uncharacterized transport system permease subunit